MLPGRREPLDDGGRGLQPCPTERPVLLPIIDVSVVVATRNGSTRIVNCLAALDAQELHPKEVLVVDDGSTDHTGTIAEAFHPANYALRVLRQSPTGPAAARNRGVMAAECPIV